MKKYLLSGFVVLAFIAYSLKSHAEQNAVTLSAPTPTPNNTTPTSSQPAAPAQTPTPAPSSSAAHIYKDGTYTGDTADAFYGNIQVQVVVSGGKISDVAFLQYPNDRGESVQINSQAMPLLKQEAIQAQSTQVDGVSGATDTSQAFIQSLSSALDRAKA